MKIRIQITILFLLSMVTSQGELPDPWKTKEYSVIEIEGRFCVYVGMHPIVLDAKLKKKSPKTYLETIEAYGPAFTSRLSSAGTWEWHFSDNTIYTTLPKWNGPLSDKIKLTLRKAPKPQIETTKQGKLIQVGTALPYPHHSRRSMKK